MAKIIVTRGLPGSGKSTWAHEWVAESPDDRVRVNRDDIRYMLYGKYWGVDEEQVTRVEEAAVRSALKARKDVVVDATHLRSAFVRKWLEFGEVEIRYFPVPVEVAIWRDVARASRGERSVGEKVIRDLAKRFHIPADGTLAAVDLEKTPAFVLKPAPAPSNLKCDAIIVDIDGTLAKMNGKRGPYDTHLYHVDDIEPNLRDIIRDLSDRYQVLITSGRSEDFRGATLDWLNDNLVAFDELIMRKSGDTRNDSIVKHDLFHEFIAPRYNVRMAFDDRNRVVDAWREMGITTAQMDYGDF